MNKIIYGVIDEDKMLGIQQKIIERENSMCDKLEEYIEFLKKIVPYDNFSRLGTVFETENEKYFYDSGTGKAYQCLENEYRIFECLINTGKVESLLKLEMDEEQKIKALGTVCSMIDSDNILKMPLYDSFTMEDRDYVENAVKENIRQIILELTQNCNLRCRYCIYNNTDEEFRDFTPTAMTWETAKKAIDYAFKHSGPKLAVTFYGGEPLVNYDLLKKCIDYSRGMESEKEEVTYSFTSNLTLMTKERAEYFASIPKCSIMGSIDGPKEIHDSFRVTVNKKGSFDAAIQGLKNLVDAYQDRSASLLSINAVLTPTYSYEKFDKVRNFFRELEWIPEKMNIKCTYLDPDTFDTAFPDGVPPLVSDELDAEERVDPFTEWSLNHIKNNSDTKFNRGNLQSSLIKIHKRVISSKPISTMNRNGCCIPGQRRLYITVDGDFKVCERVGKSVSIGNVDTGIDFTSLYKTYIQEYHDNAVSHCRDCWCVHLCKMCYASYCNENGIDFEKKFSACETEREGCRKELQSYYRIMEINPESLEYLNEIEMI